ncbi:MAG: ABC transporter ATP-binding protein [Nitrospirae bacterium]|nr:MAG: ABC transporter ATP-binding protein [Nitrospirota bacterium]
MITVQHVTKRYGAVIAIDQVSFHVNRGEIVAFLGPNGAGKTTLMRIITCYMPATEGTVKVDGFDCFDHSLEVKKRIGYLPETPPLYHELTVTEYLTFVGRLKGLIGPHLSLRLATVIDQLGLGDVQSRLIGHLSRGFRQRVGLAQAIIHDPAVLILDEPTVGLDPKQILEMREFIRQLAGSHTIILSTHILSEATAVCQRVIILHQGRIVAIDTPQQLAARLRQSEKFRLTVQTAPPDWMERLRAFPGVMNVFIGPTPNTTIVECELHRDIRQDLARFVVEQGVGLLELSPMTMSLEEVFLTLTRQTSPEQDARGLPSSPTSSTHTSSDLSP